MNESLNKAFLNSQRIAFHPVDLDHLPLYEKWGNDDDIRRYRRFFFPRSSEEIKNRYVEAIRSNEKHAFEVWHMEDNCPIGICNLHEIDWVSRTAEVGMFIGDKKYWKQGLGTEIASLITQYGFKELNLRKLKATIYRPNEGSQKIFSKIGYNIEAVLEKELFVDGEYLDMLYYVKYRPD